MKYLPFAAALAIVLLQGCASVPPQKIELMPAPAVYEQAGAPNGTAVGIPVHTDRLEMLYATNRAPSSDGDEGDEPWYSGERGYLVRLGSAEIDFADASDSFALIDVEEADHFDDGNGHAYFRKSPWVSSDILMTLRHGLEPAERGLEQRNDSPVWRFPRDYPAHSGKALTQTVDAVR